MTKTTELKTLLKQYFGFSTFKNNQEKVILALLKGKSAFVIMPTGGGKSLCYQLPAILLEGTAIVISPLIALMKNQVDMIRGSSDNDSIAHVLNSTLNKKELERVYSDIREKRTKLLYVAPESLAKVTNIEFFKTIKVSFLAIDEAHCISEWGHDFRPEYRNIRRIINSLDPTLSVMALTATATPKVQEDILKNLQIKDAEIFKSSFNRPNLYYEVRPKTKTVLPEIIKVVKQYSEGGNSGIVYCLSRKNVEDIASLLQANDVRALPYHAGLDAKTRTRNQEQFLMDQCEVMVATIAFGMGIDKPDVRFVIHHSIPKSIESYYQETGRAGRDGGKGYCLAFYSYADIEKLESFLDGKTLSEKERSLVLLDDMVAYAETAVSRRKYILKYFGEEFNNETDPGGDLDDNVRFPKKQLEVKSEFIKLLQVIQKTQENYKTKDLALVLVGKSNAIIKSHGTSSKPFFGIGKEKDQVFWKSLIRQSLVNGYLRKNIESYGTIELTEKALSYLSSPTTYYISEPFKFPTEQDQMVLQNSQSSTDKVLMKMLIQLRKEIAETRSIPPYTVFQESSLEDMCLKYPIMEQELLNINGVGQGKAKKFGTPFVDLIKRHVEDNNITRPDDLIIKSNPTQSAFKPYLIQSIDRKIPFDQIASTKGLSMDELVEDMEKIVSSGTKLDIEYWIESLFEDDEIEELYDYFLEKESDDINQVVDEFGNLYEEQDLRTFRVYFLSAIGH